MKIVSILFIALFYLTSCAIFKNNNSKIIVKGKIEIHKPYCGGAKPTPEMEKGYNEAYSNATFFVKRKMNNDPKSETVLKFKTDKNGNYKFKIKKGSYIIIHEDKTLAFEKFLEKYKISTDKFLEFIGNESSKEVYQQFDFSLDVNEQKENNFVYKSKCFSGMNPLLKYIGPLPQ